MFYSPPRDIRVSIDVGCKHHQVTVGLSSAQYRLAWDALLDLTNKEVNFCRTAQIRKLTFFDTFAALGKPFPQINIKAFQEQS